MCMITGDLKIGDVICDNRGDVSDNRRDVITGRRHHLG